MGESQRTLRKLEFSKTGYDLKNTISCDDHAFGNTCYYRYGRVGMFDPANLKSPLLRGSGSILDDLFGIDRAANASARGRYQPFCFGVIPVLCWWIARRGLGPR